MPQAQSKSVMVHDYQNKCLEILGYQYIDMEKEPVNLYEGQFWTISSSPSKQYEQFRS